MLLLSAAVAAALLPGAHASALGAMKLDNYTFDKMLSVPGLSLMVKIDKSYAYGEKEDAFKEVAKLAYPVKNFIVAEVPVSDYGDKENDDLRERFKLKTDDFPAFFLFKAGRSSDDGIKFEGFPDPTARKPASWDDDEDGPWEPPMLSEVTATNLVMWLKKQGIKMPSIGTIAELDEVVHKYMKAPSDALIAEAKKLAETEFPNDKKAPVYIKIMEKVKEKGAEYLDKELGRVQKISAGKVTPEKKTELDDKIRILNVFLTKDE